jgi:hypothetical protein
MIRVNKFAVPERSRDEFCSILLDTHAVVRRQEGFVRDYILERPAGPGELSIVTVIEFTSPDVIDGVAAALAEFDRGRGVGRQELMARLGVSAEMGLYQRLEL